MKIIIGLKEYNFFFENYESFNKIQKIVIEISEGFYDEDLVRVSESLYN